jgi:hypothetical protein
MVGAEADTGTTGAGWAIETGWGSVLVSGAVVAGKSPSSSSASVSLEVRTRTWSTCLRTTRPSANVT